MRTVLLVAALALTACGTTTSESPGYGPPDKTEPSASPSDSAEPSDGPGAGRMPEESFVGTALDSARDVLTEQGFTVETLTEGGCLEGVVVSQAPAAGAEVEAGESVQLTVLEPPPTWSCVQPLARRPLRQLAAWVRDGGAAPEFAEEVRVLQGNEHEVTLTGTQAADGDRWQLTNPYAGYAPVHVLEWLREQAGTRLVVAPPAFCPERVSELSPDLVDRIEWSYALVNTGVDACLDQGALQVWVDEDSRIETVNFLRGGP